MVIQARSGPPGDLNHEEDASAYGGSSTRPTAPIHAPSQLPQASATCPGRHNWTVAGAPHGPPGATNPGNKTALLHALLHHSYSCTDTLRRWPLAERSCAVLLTGRQPEPAGPPRSPPTGGHPFLPQTQKRHLQQRYPPCSSPDPCTAPFAQLQHLVPAPAGSHIRQEASERGASFCCVEGRA